MTRPDSGIISQQIESYIARLADLAKEIDDFIESKSLPQAEIDFDRAIEIAIVELEAEGAKQGTLKEKAKARASNAKMRFLTQKMIYQALQNKLDITRTIISAKKAQLGVQDII